MRCLLLLVGFLSVVALAAETEKKEATSSPATEKKEPPKQNNGPNSSPFVSTEALETALTDKRYMKRQLDCALGDGPCDPVGRKLRSMAPLVLRGTCPRCSDDQHRQIKKVLAHIQANYPQQWTRIVKQYAGAPSK